MKRLTIAAMIVLVFCLAGCGSGASGSSSGTASTTSSASQAAAQNAQSGALPDRAGFGEATVRPIEVKGVEFLLPDYYAQGESKNDNMFFTGSDANGNEENVFVVCVTRESFKAASVEKFHEAKDAVVTSAFEKGSFKDVKITSSADGGVADLPSSTYVLSGKHELNGTEVPFIAKSAIFLKQDLQVGLIELIQYNGVKSDYFPDFEKTLASARVLQQGSSGAESPDQASDGVSPSLKEALDSYEAFMDEYIEFMQKYKGSSDVAGMMNDYLSYMKKYTELVGKIDAMDTKNMSAADSAYYLEVTTRVSQKLLNAAV